MVAEGRRLLKWHYTTGEKLRLILECGYLAAATKGIDPGERPAVWFTTGADWEPTATKGMSLDGGGTRPATMTEMILYAGGLVRIGVDDDLAPYDWRAWKKKSRVGRRTAAALEMAAREVGSCVRDWWVSFEPVPMSDWSALERGDCQGNWVSMV